MQLGASGMRSEWLQRESFLETLLMLKNLQTPNEFIFKWLLFFQAINYVEENIFWHKFNMFNLSVLVQKAKLLDANKLHHCSHQF